MYADRVEALAYRSIKERLNGDSAAGSSRRRPTSGKRRREDDDKWEHDLFESDMPQLSNPRFGVKDLRLKLQRKNIEQATKKARGTALGGARDLREKLSGKLDSRSIKSQPFRPKLAPEARKPPRNTAIAAITEVPARETMKIAGSASKNMTQQKVETADSFLQSLGLEKYSITFQAEEVDMTALVHMGEEDLKAMGIPMGPRKKILLALESKADN